MMKPMIVVLAAALATACAAKKPGETTAHGTLALSGYPSAPLAVVATSSHGNETRAIVSASGTFSLAFAKGDAYALSVETAAGRVPIAMPRRTGKLDRTFAVGSDGVIIALGNVRYRVANAPSTIVAQTGACDANGTGDYECVQDDGQSDCEGGDGDGEQQDDGSKDDAEQIDAHAEMAVPDRSAPSVASGCDGEGSD